VLEPKMKNEKGGEGVCVCVSRVREIVVRGLEVG